MAKCYWLLFSFFAITLLASSPGLAGDRTVVLASLEWPPYTGKTLKEQGALAKIVREAFAAMGYKLEIRFLPWNRGLDEVRNASGIDGYFPEYDSRERREEFHYSDAMGKSPLGFAKRTSHDASWGSIDDLERLTIGVVTGYVNTQQFDDRVRQGRIRTDEASNDVLNLRKALAGRVDMAVADLNVFNYLMNRDHFLLAHRDEMAIDARLLGINDLFVCFKWTESGLRLKEIFNEGLDRINALDIQRDYFETLSQ